MKGRGAEMISSIRELFKVLGSPDAIVVEGYDGVGKGRVLDALSEFYSVTPYRPDYNLWQRHDHRYKDRWKVSGFFWDVYSHFMEGQGKIGHPMLFDRGVMSGAVYAHDDTIAEDYKKLLRDREVLHILVVCDAYSYAKFASMRDPNIPMKKVAEEYQRVLEFTEEYIRLFELADVSYIIYFNSFDDKLSDSIKDKCMSCGHYSYGFCRHPDKNCKVEGYSSRCEKSTDKEVQDINGSEMLSL